MTNPDLLRSAGEALYGPRWQSDLARALGVAERTVRRWVAGDDHPRPGVWADLLELARARRDALAPIIEELERLVP